MGASKPPQIKLSWLVRQRMRKQGGSRKERRKETLNSNLNESLIQQMKPRALRRANIRGLTRASTTIVRKETIQRKVV